MALILPFNGVTPRVHPSAFLAPTAVLVGDVTVGAECSIWFGAVLRGDNPNHPIIIGPRTSIQDQCIVHVGDWGPTIIGPNVTVGHGAVFESCTIGEGSLIGMNAVILQNASVGDRCVVAAGAVVRQGAEIGDRSLVAGVPAVVKKKLEGRSASWVEGGGAHYVELSREYMRQGIQRVDPLDARVREDPGKPEDQDP